MNSPERTSETNNVSSVYLMLRCSIFPAIFLLLVLFIALFITNFSISFPIYVPCHCKIISSSVDIRSAKVCELGLLSYKVKHVFYPSETQKFRCRYDYYWASVFKVEYTDYFGHLHTAFAEAPNEALPHDCRPSFDAAWMALDRFKVNETYDCWYTLGISKLNLHHDEYFNCQADQKSVTEMLKRYLILSTEVLTSWFSHTDQGQHRYVSWEVIVGAVIGFLTSLITFAFGKLLYLLRSRIATMSQVRDVCWTCFLVAYFSFVCWLAVQKWANAHT